MDGIALFATLRFFFPFLILATTAYFARRMVLALERRVDNKNEMAELRARIAELEQSQEATEQQLMRLQAAHEFSVQLLATRVAVASEPHR